MRAAVTNADRFSPLDSTLVIVLLRNVYDWTEAMRRLPYHSPSHVNLTLDVLLQADLAHQQRPSRPQSLVHTRRLSRVSRQSPWTFGRRDANDAFSLVQCESNLRDNEAVLARGRRTATTRAPRRRRSAPKGRRAQRPERVGGGRRVSAPEPGLPLRRAATDGSVFQVSPYAARALERAAALGHAAPSRRYYEHRYPPGSRTPICWRCGPPRWNRDLLWAANLRPPPSQHQGSPPSLCRWLSLGTTWRRAAGRVRKNGGHQRRGKSPRGCAG